MLGAKGSEVGVEVGGGAGGGSGGIRPPGFEPLRLGDEIEPEERQRQRLAPRFMRTQAEVVRYFTLQDNQERESALAVAFFLDSGSP